MKRKRLPSLPDTGRRYLDDTRRARLASPGVERYVRRGGGRMGPALMAIAVGAALVAAMLLLS